MASEAPNEAPPPAAATLLPPLQETYLLPANQQMSKAKILPAMKIMAMKGLTECQSVRVRY